MTRYLMVHPTTSRHTKHLPLLLVLAGLLLPLLAVAAPLPNGSAEDFDPLMPGEPSGWETNHWGDVSPIYTWQDATLTPGVAHQGDHSLRVDVTTPNKPDAELQGDAKWWTKPFTLDAGLGKYRITNWYRSNISTRLVLWVTDGAEQSQYLPVATLGPALSWSPNDYTVTLPGWAKQMRVLHVIDRTGWLETDSYTATRLPPPEKQQAKVSLTFDDGWVTAYAYLVNQMDKRGITGTHFIITEYMDKPGYTADYIGSKKVKELLGLGHEIGSHTLNHEDMSLATPEQLNENLELSKKRLENLGAKVVSFAWPYGYYTMPYAERAHQTYNLVRTVKAGINVPPYNTTELWGFVVTNTTTVAEIEEAVRQTEEIKDGWLILIYHRADEEPPNDAYVTPQSFVDTLDMLQKRGADVRPMGAVLGLWQPVPLPPEPTKVMQCCKAFDPPDVFTPSSKVEGETEEPAADGCQSHRTADSGLAPLLVLLAAGLGVLRRRKSGLA